MTEENSDHVLPNGYTFIAVTAGIHGVWAKANNPIDAIRDAFCNSGKESVAMYVIYAKDDAIEVNAYYGNYTYTGGHKPIRLGIFTVCNFTGDYGEYRDKATKMEERFLDGEYPLIKPVAHGDFNSEHSNCLEWMIEGIEVDHDEGTTVTAQ